jgi:hypothetical protein
MSSPTALDTRWDQGETPARTMLEDWIQHQDVSARLVQFDQDFLQRLEYSRSSDAHSANSIRSASSMAPALIHQVAASYRAPSLGSYDAETEATLTEASISTGLASHITGV